MLQAKRGNAEFVEAVEKDKADRHAQARIEKKRKNTGEAGAGGSVDVADMGGDGSQKARKSFKRTFKQTPALAMTHGENSALIQRGGVLHKVWGGKGE